MEVQKYVCPSAAAWSIFLYVTANFLVLWLGDRRNNDKIIKPMLVLADGAPTRQITTAPSMKHRKVLEVLFPTMCHFPAAWVSQKSRK